MKKRKSNNALKLGAFIFAIGFLIAAWIFIGYYKKVYDKAVSLSFETQFIFVGSDWSYQQLLSYLSDEGILSDTISFNWVANRKSFDSPKAGRYLLKDGMSNNELINLLRSGAQEPVNVTFNSIRTRADLAARVGAQLELDSMDLFKALTSAEVASEYGFNATTFVTMFIPNTYEFYWNTDADDFIKRMAKEYKRFWNSERKAKAKKLNMSQSEVTILASIVQAEQLEHPDERPRIAGLYVNRLKRKMPLQSDPTLIYAIGDFSIKRVLNKHKTINSTYNTYQNLGLPPGPINIAEISSIDAVLNYEEHNYLYMCAKPDFSSYHNFSKTLSQHNVYANQYRRELNRRRILK